MLSQGLARQTNHFASLKAPVNDSALRELQRQLLVFRSNNPVGTQGLFVTNQQRRAVPKIFPHAVKTLVKRKPPRDLVTPAAPKAKPAPATTPKGGAVVASIRNYMRKRREIPYRPDPSRPYIYICFPRRKDLDYD